MTTANINTLYVALELGCDKWVLASATQAAEKPRFRTVAARNLAAFNEEIAKAKARFGLPADAPVCTGLPVKSAHVNCSPFSRGSVVAGAAGGTEHTERRRGANNRCLPLIPCPPP